MRTTRILTSALLIAGSTFGLAGSVGAIERSTSGGDSASLGWVNNCDDDGVCTCDGVVDCEEMFEELECASSWINEDDPFNPYGECVGPTPKETAPTDLAPAAGVVAPSTDVQVRPAATKSSRLISRFSVRMFGA